MTDIVQKTVGANALYVIDESNNTLVVDQTNGRVGINNTNPGYNLTITGATHTSANLSAGTDLFLVDEGNSRVSVGTTTGVSGFAFNVLGNTTLIGDVLTGTAMKWDNTNSRLGIGTTVPDAPLHVKITGNDDALILETTRATDDTTSSPDLTFISAKKAAGNYLGGIDFKGVNDVDSVQTYTTITSRIDSPADGAEAGSLFITNMHQGSNRTFLFMEGNTTGAGFITTNYNGQDINFGLQNLSVANGGPGGYGLYHDASTGRIGINDSSPASTLEITALGGDDDNPEMRITRSGVTTQYLGFTNEDASGGIIAMHSPESNKKTLALESVHNSGGSAAGDNLIILRTGAASGPTERVRLSDMNNLFTIQSGTALLVDDTISVGAAAADLVTGSTNPTTAYPPSISVSKSSTTVSGGLFSSSVGESAITNNQAGWWLTAGGMNTNSKYTPALKFGSTDPAFTTDNPKYLAGITGRSTQTYSADDHGGMAMDFLTFPSSGGVAGTPTTRMTIDQNGRVGIGANMGSPSAAFHVRTQNDASTFVALFESEEDGASASPDIGLLRDSTSPAASDDLGHIRFRGNHSGGSQLDYADMFAEIGSPTDGSEAGYLNLRVAHANNSGNMVDFIRLRGDASGAGVIINDSGRADVDFRVETDNQNTAFLIDASADTATFNVDVGIGTSPSASLHVSTADNIVAKFLSTDATASIELADNGTTNNAALTRVGQTLTLCANGGNVAIGNSISSYNGSAPAAGQLLIGDATAGVWDAATLTAGTNITITNADGAITIAAAGGGGGSPGGANTQVQFNNGGAFGGSADMIFIAPNMAVGFAAAGQSSGSISSDTINAVNVAASANITAVAKLQGADLTTTTTSGYALTTTANHVWPGAPVGSNPTVMPAIDLAAAPYDFATLGGAGNCNQTHYLVVIAGDPAAGNAIIMPDPAAAGLPPGARWTISFNDGSGQPQLVAFPAVPLNGGFTQIEATAVGAVTIFTDGVGWYVESVVDTSGAGRIRFL